MSLFIGTSNKLNLSLSNGVLKIFYTPHLGTSDILAILKILAQHFKHSVYMLQSSSSFH